MLHEPALRRQGFRPGPQDPARRRPGVDLPGAAGSDARRGRSQARRGPAEVTAAHDPDCEATVAAVLEAEDEAERLRAELALAILLLATNYDLAPSDYGALLDYPPGDPALAAVQRAFHDLAMDYVRAGRPTAESRPATRGWTSNLPDRKTGFDVLLGRVFRGWTWHGADRRRSLPVPPVGASVRPMHGA